MRELFDRDLGFTDADREDNFKRSILGANVKDSTVIIGIICSIGFAENLRALARRKIAGYNEIYLKKDIQVSIKNDVKGVIKENMGKTPICGLDARFDTPEHPDLVLEVDKMTEDETFRAVVDYIANKYGDEYALKD